MGRRIVTVDAREFEIRRNFFFGPKIQKWQILTKKNDSPCVSGVAAYTVHVRFETTAPKYLATRLVDE